MTGVRVSETVAARVSWALLGEWWCVRADASEDECAKIIAESFVDAWRARSGCGPKAAREQYWVWREFSGEVR